MMIASIVVEEFVKYHMPMTVNTIAAIAMAATKPRFFQVNASPEPGSLCPISTYDVCRSWFCLFKASRVDVAPEIGYRLLSL